MEKAMALNSETEQDLGPSVQIHECTCPDLPRDAAWHFLSSRDQETAFRHLGTIVVDL